MFIAQYCICKNNMRRVWFKNRGYLRFRRHKIISAVIAPKCIVRIILYRKMWKREFKKKWRQPVVPFVWYIRVRLLCLAKGIPSLSAWPNLPIHVPVYHYVRIAQANNSSFVTRTRAVIVYAADDLFRRGRSAKRLPCCIAGSPYVFTTSLTSPPAVGSLNFLVARERAAPWWLLASRRLSYCGVVKLPPPAQTI